jgi:predicted glutamine amidotransferase
MCQLLGMNCNNPTDVTFSFRGFAHRGGRTDHHADGWGIAFFEDRGLRHFVDHLPACESPVAELIRRYPIQSRNVIAHIRKATQGHVNLQNCHPFVRELWGRYWVFAHNGDLKDFRPRLHGSFHPVGDTDSEHAFCWLMQELAKSHADVPSIEADAARTRAPRGAPRHLQLHALQRAGAVVARLDEPLVHRAPAPLHAGASGRRGRGDRLRPAHHARGPRRDGRDGAADHQRDLDGLHAGRAGGVRGRPASELNAVVAM